MATFPLKCIICSDEYNYSDVSHLLTHMSSKRHLAAQFKATVRARQDPTLTQKLLEFDQWYDQNNLAELLSERIAKKDGKKLEAKAAIRKNRGQRNRKRTKKEEIAEQDENSLPDLKYSVPSIPIDPNMCIKEEPGLYIEDHMESYCTCYKQRTFGEETHHTLGASEQAICPQCWLRFEAPFNNQITSNYEAEYSWTSELPRSYKEEDRSFGSHSVFESVENIESYQEQAMTGVQERLGNSSEDGEGEDDEDFPPVLPKEKNSKLKGIVWPGMHLFDAASPEGIRMRNQRKKVEISGLLQRSSQQTQPTEMVHYADTWIFKEDRVIDGEVHSPPPEDLPLPVKRQKRRVLAEKSANQIIKKADRRRGPYQKSREPVGVENCQPSQTLHLSSTLASAHDFHDTNTLLSSRGFYGSPVKVEPRHDQFRNPEVRGQSTAYPFVTNYGLGHRELAPGRSPYIDEQEPSGFPYYLAPLRTLHRLSNLRRPTVASTYTNSRGSPLEHVPDDVESKEDLGLNRGPANGPNIQRLPSISTLDHFLSTSHHGVVDRQPAYSQYTIQDQLTGQQFSTPNEIIQSGIAAGLKSNRPETPTKTSNYADYSLAYTGKYEDSSGDETIDQGIDDTPTPCLTRAAAVHRLRGNIS